MKYLFFFLFTAFNASSQKPLGEFIDADYLRTVSLYSYTPQDKIEERYTQPAVVNLTNTNNHLILEFDDLRAQYTQYKVKIIHCDADWKQSRLLDMEYLKEINEFFINDYKVSQNTKMQYYHYQFIVPKPMLTGNYVLQMYENDDLVVQRRFWVFETKIDIAASVQAAADPEYWKTHQQLNLKLELGNYRIGIPHRELKVLIRQNQSVWKEVNNSHLNNTGRNTFTLQQFTSDYLFPGGNEFRFVDLTSSQRRGQNVQDIELGKPDIIFTLPQRNRAVLNFTDSYDNNGAYYVANLAGTDPDLSSEYVETIFQLPKGNFEGTPVIYGKLTNWDYIPMEYDGYSQNYQIPILLKNGVYDFAFGLKSGVNSEVDRSYFEGNFNLTGNLYEIFVYHLAPGQRHIHLVGYQTVHMNRRQ